MCTDANVKTKIQIENIIKNLYKEGLATYDAMRYVLYFLALKRLLTDTIDRIEKTTAGLKQEYFRTLFALQQHIYAYKDDVSKDFLIFESTKWLEKELDLQENLFKNFFVDNMGIEVSARVLKILLSGVNELSYHHNNENIAEIMKDYIAETSYKSMRAYNADKSGFATTPALSELFKIFANIKDGESFCDGAIGRGISTMFCTKDTSTIITGMDTNIASIQIATLYAILLGKENIDLSVGDFTSTTFKKKYDKIVMDIPIRTKLNNFTKQQELLCSNWLQDCSCITLDVLMLAKTLEVLEKDGRAVLVLPYDIISGCNKSYKKIRENILKNSMLKAIVNIPCLHYDAHVQSVLIVLEKNQGKIMFLDMSKNENIFFEKCRREPLKLTEEGKNKLVSLLENNKPEDGVFTLVGLSEIVKNNYDIHPARYLAKKEENPIRKRSIQSIDEEIQSLTNEFLELLEKNRTLFSGFDL